MSDYTEENLRNIVTTMVNIIPYLCGCRGKGWLVTDLDTVHQCPRHFRNQPHPEFSEEGAFDDFDWEKVFLQLDREAYGQIRQQAVGCIMSHGLGSDSAHRYFLAEVKYCLEDPQTAKPSDWLRAAARVLNRFQNESLTARCTG